jgi:hypothetical protein
MACHSMGSLSKAVLVMYISKLRYYYYYYYYYYFTLS